MISKAKILVVDDEQNICTLLSELLNDEGHKITTVKNGYQAIEEVRKDSFDLILLDVIMPSMNGLETYREIKKIDPKIPTILMSGYPAKGLIDQALSEGVKIYMDKPFDIDEVITIIEEILVNTAKFTKIVETYIKKYPTQWLWTYDRWRIKTSAAVLRPA